MSNVFKTLTTILVLMCSFIANAAWTVRYQHTDTLGSVIAESNSQGTITQRFDYKPFGEGTPTQKAGVGYTGHLEDTDLGLTYMQQRYYDPVIGRFYSNDPVDMLGHMQKGNPTMGFNRYAYANNNPYKYKDPDGNFLNFAVNFVVNVAVEATIQYATTGSVDVGSAVADAAIGMINPAKSLQRLDKVADVIKGACSFDAQTLVLTERGLKPIIDVKVGDKVWARNDVTQEENWQEVVANFNEYHKHVRALSLKTADGKVETLITTDEHPFYHEKNGWLPSAALKTNDRVIARGGRFLTVVKSDVINKEQLAYNLTVANDHTYFVGEQNAWVHNACRLDLNGNKADFTKKQKTEFKERNRAQNNGDLKCEDCGTKLVEGQPSVKGGGTPSNQAQIHHEPPIEEGGGRHSDGKVLCPECHQDRHNAGGK